MPAHGLLSTSSFLLHAASNTSVAMRSSVFIGHSHSLTRGIFQPPHPGLYTQALFTTFLRPATITATAAFTHVLEVIAHAAPDLVEHER